MDFFEILMEVREGLAYNPYAAKVDDTWVGDFISIDFLNEHFSRYSTAEEMINATESEGLKLYFVWLREQGILN